MTAPRDAIAHSQFDEPTRELLLSVYDELQREFGMDDGTAMKVVDRMLALADTGERSYENLVQGAAPSASGAIEQDTEHGSPGS